MGFEEDSSGVITVLAVRENHGRVYSCPSNPGSACCWLVLHTDTELQRKRNHQAGDLAMTLWTNSICGGVSLYHCFCQMGLQLLTRTVIFQAKVKGCPRSLKSQLSSSLSFQTDPCPVTWSVTIQLPILPPFSSFLKIHLQQAEVRSQVFPVAPPDSGS